MTPRPSFRAAAVGAAAGIALAAAVNAVVTVIAGNTLVVPGELGMSQVLTYTAVMVVPAAVVLWLLPRWFVVIVLAVAVLTLPFPWMEFGAPIAYWLGTMHLITGACAAIVAPRVAQRLTRA